MKSGYKTFFLFAEPPFLNKYNMSEISTIVKSLAISLGIKYNLYNIFALLNLLKLVLDIFFIIRFNSYRFSTVQTVQIFKNLGVGQKFLHLFCILFIVTSLKFAGCCSFFNWINLIFISNLNCYPSKRSKFIHSK